MIRARIVAIVTTVMLAVGLMPALAFAANGGSLTAGDVVTQATEYNIWVAETQVTSDNAANITGKGISGKVSYDAATNTLTLDNATISEDFMAPIYTNGVATYYYYNIYQRYEGVGSLTIKLVGNNKLSNPNTGTDLRYRGIGFGATDDNLEFTGDGTLTVTASATKFIIGIECESLTIGPNVTVKANISASDDSCTAVRASGAATVKGTLEVSASGKDYSTGFDALGGLAVPKGGKIIANAKDQGTSTFTGASAIDTYKSNASIDGYVKATSTWAGFESWEGYTMTVGATGEVIASGEKHALEEVAVKLGSAKLQILAGDTAKSAKAVKASDIGEAKYVHICNATAAASATAKKANPMTVRAKAVSFSAAKLKAKARSVGAKKAFTVKKAKGKVTYAKVKGTKKITIAKNGKVTVKKGAKKGTYKVKVKVRAAGNTVYKAKAKTVTLTVKVK